MYFYNQVVIVGGEFSDVYVNKYRDNGGGFLLFMFDYDGFGVFFVGRFYRIVDEVVFI